MTQFEGIMILIYGLAMGVVYGIGFRHGMKEMANRWKDHLRWAWKHGHRKISDVIDVTK